MSRCLTVRRNHGISRTYRGQYLTLSKVSPQPRRGNLCKVLDRVISIIVNSAWTPSLQADIGMLRACTRAIIYQRPLQLLNRRVRNFVVNRPRPVLAFYRILTLLFDPRSRETRSRKAIRYKNRARGAPRFKNEGGPASAPRPSRPRRIAKL